MNLLNLKNTARILTLSFLMGSGAYASEQILEDTQESLSFNPMYSPDIREEIFSFVTSKDQLSLSLVSKEFNASVEGYYDSTVMHFFDKLFLGNSFNKFFAKKALEKKLKNDGFLVISHDSPFNMFLPENVSPLNIEAMEKNLEISSLLYKKLFGEDLEKHIPTQFQHLLASFPGESIFLENDNLDSSAQRFFQRNAENLLKKIDSISKETPYWSFTTNPSQETLDKLQMTPHTIVMMDTELETEDNKATLQKLLGSNPDHTVLLDVDRSSFVSMWDRSSDLKLSQGDVGAIKHLILTNKSGNVLSIQDSFLSGCPSLESFTMNGFINLTEISYSFLQHSPSLKHVNATALWNLKQIYNQFAVSCESLESVHLSSLYSLETISRLFVMKCPSVKSVVLKGLANLKTVEESFLSGSTSLEGLEVGNFSTITSVGAGFLFSSALSEENKQEIQNRFNAYGIKCPDTFGHPWFYVRK